MLAATALSLLVSSLPVQHESRAFSAPDKAVNGWPAMFAEERMALILGSGPWMHMSRWIPQRLVG